MFRAGLKQLLTMAVLAAAGRGTSAPTADKLVLQLPKPPVSRSYPRSSEGERVRRMGQILQGTLKRENGLVDPGQLISRPATGGRRYHTLQIQRPY